MAPTLIPVFRNIRHEVVIGGYRLADVYATRWGWYTTVSGTRIPPFPTKEEAARYVMDGALALARRTA